MLTFLKNHPFAVDAFFKTSLVLSFAAPKEQVRRLIPACLEPDAFQDKWGFIAVAMVQTKDLRPKGIPKAFGNDFFLIGYRVFVRFINSKGKRLRGLFILKSETDKKQMQFFGNIFTHYNYSNTDIKQINQGNIIRISSEKSDLDILVNKEESDNVDLPDGSPFANRKEARRFAGPLPFTFTYNPAEREVLVIEGVRENWDPKAVRILDYHISFLDRMGLDEIRLANAFIINNIPYRWEKGKKEKWIQGENHFKEF